MNKIKYKLLKILNCCDESVPDWIVAALEEIVSEIEDDK